MNEHFRRDWNGLGNRAVDTRRCCSATPLFVRAGANRRGPDVEASIVVSGQRLTQDSELGPDVAKSRFNGVLPKVVCRWQQLFFGFSMKLDGRAVFLE